MPSAVLLVVSAATEVPLADGSRIPAGYLPGEATAVCDVLSGAGHAVTIATPGGLRPTPDPQSPPEQTAAAERIDGLREPAALSEIEDATGYAALVVLGGRGALADLPGDPTLGRLLLEARDGQVPIAAIGQGAAALMAADRSREEPWPFAGARMTVASDAEEEADLAYSPATMLGEAGAVVEVAEPFASNVVVDGLLVTGQNPASAEPAARTLLGLMARST